MARGRWVALAAVAAGSAFLAVGFVGVEMALDTLFRLDDEHALFVLGRAPGGSVAGFLHFALCRMGGALSLSSMPRLRTTPNGFNEWLVCVAIEWAREHGFERVSLNFAPFAA